MLSRKVRLTVTDVKVIGYNFALQSVQADSLTPTYGPAYGGTLVTISGNNLLVGADRKVIVDGNPCRIVR